MTREWFKYSISKERFHNNDDRFSFTDQQLIEDNDIYKKRFIYSNFIKNELCSNVYKYFIKNLENKETLFIGSSWAWWEYFLMMSCNVVSPQVMWIKKIRTNIIWSFIISIVVNIGMWFERFVIIVTSLHRDYLPSSWTMFSPTFVDIGIFIGTIGFFFVLFLLYARSFPVVAQAEIKTILKSSGETYKKNRDK